MKRVNKTLITAMFLLTFLSGCWDIKDIDQRNLPLVIGIAKADNNEYKVTAQIPIPKLSGQTQSGPMSRIVTSKGESFSSALGQIKTNSEDAVDYSHVRLIVIQKNLTKNQKELRQLIKFLMDSKEIPMKAMLAITNDHIEKLLSNINDKLGVDSTSLYDFFNKGAGWAPEISSAPIWEVYRSLFSYTEDITIPVVDSGKDTVLNYKGAAVLKKGKITQRISPNENQLINLFQNKSAKGKIESVGFASVMVTKSTIENKTVMKNNKPLVYSDLNLKIDILERKADITNNQIRERLEKLTQKQFYHIFKQAQKSNTDIFGFGQYFRDQIPYDDLKNWRGKYYPKLKVNFQVHVSME
ncbi:Ger(x)C family germination protein [Scopulibacillus darangshiensis]|uniref:Ger(X)C family germination protein n=1 Tax=Scopulibacillus darangshiensis TaxID=442528 RepID=A0A4R2NIF6_9BACL|nr:Ger(x)C family spore germination protein [Scopulibacillus darangshiensis]TCP21299.1 Ger(x)C family germination protein [Scopulibacillus darangshiensis]